MKNDINIKAELEKIEKAEKELHKIIDDEVELEAEIKEVSEKAALDLEMRPMTMIEIQGRKFMLIASLYNDNKNSRHILIVAREKTELITPSSTILKADALIDTNYTKKENLVCCIKGLLGHITGYIKPEALD